LPHFAVLVMAGVVAACLGEGVQLLLNPGGRAGFLALVGVVVGWWALQRARRRAVAGAATRRPHPE